MEQNYRAVFSQDPVGLTLDFDQLKAGKYFIEGDISCENWEKVCTELGIQAEGGCHVRLEIEKEAGVIHILGTLESTMLRECTRTLEAFSMQEAIKVDEKFLLYPADEETDMEFLPESLLDVGDFVLQSLLLHMEPYPVHPNTLSVPRGEFGMEDGLKEEPETQKNPFSMLKDLK